MKKLKTLIAAAVVLCIPAVCSQAAVFAAETAEAAAETAEAAAGYVKLLEMNDETIDMIIEDLTSSLALKAEHPELYSATPEILELCNTVQSIFQKQYTDKYMVTVNTQALIDRILLEDEMEMFGLSSEELMEFIGPFAGTIIVQQVINAYGINMVAFNSILKASKSYVADLDRETLLLLKYDDDYSVVIDIGISGDHVITATASIIPTDAVPQIHYLLI